MPCICRAYTWHMTWWKVSCDQKYMKSMYLSYADHMSGMCQAYEYEVQHMFDLRALGSYVRHMPCSTVRGLFWTSYVFQWMDITYARHMAYAMSIQVRMDNIYTRWCLAHVICHVYARQISGIYMAYNICKAYARHMPDVAAPAAQPQI